MKGGVMTNDYINLDIERFIEGYKLKSNILNDPNKNLFFTDYETNYSETEKNINTILENEDFMNELFENEEISKVFFEDMLQSYYYKLLRSFGANKRYKDKFKELFYDFYKKIFQYLNENNKTNIIDKINFVYKYLRDDKKNVNSNRDAVKKKSFKPLDFPGLNNKSKFTSSPYSSELIFKK